MKRVKSLRPVNIKYKRKQTIVLIKSIDFLSLKLKQSSSSSKPDSKGGQSLRANAIAGGSQRNTPSPKEKSPSAADAPRVTSPPALIAQSGYASPKALTSSLDIQPSMVGAEAVPPKTINGKS